MTLLCILVVNTVVIGLVVAITPVSLNAGIRGGVIATLAVMVPLVVQAWGAKRRRNP